MDTKLLVEQMISGDEKAFEDIVEIYYGKALRLAYLISGNYADSQDIVQETFINCFKNASKIREPQHFESYASSKYDLVLTGHVHGGQFRLPFIGGLYGPGQGLLPEYDSGVYSSSDTDMVVSRGIGNSVFPVRFNNRPEVILITLKTA